MTARRARRQAAAAATAVAVTLAACGGDDDSDGARAGGGSVSGASEAFCDEAAAFPDATAAVRGLASADEMQAAVDRLDGVAAEAPSRMADEFEALTGVLDRLVTAMRSVEGGSDAEALEAMQNVLTLEIAAEVDDASRTVEAFLEVECGIDHEEAGDDAPATTPTSTTPADPAALGADPVLAPLAAACHDGDMVTCDELYLASPTGSPYEAYGDTCGQRTTVDDFCVDIYPPP